MNRRVTSEGPVYTHEVAGPTSEGGTANVADTGTTVQGDVEADGKREAGAGAAADRGTAEVAEAGASTEARETAEELAQLRQAMESRPVIDQARGVLMASWQCTPETAWQILVETSQHTNTKVREIAALLVRSTHAEPMPRWLRKAVLAARTRVTRDARRNGTAAG